MSRGPKIAIGVGLILVLVLSRTWLLSRDGFVPGSAVADNKLRFIQVSYKVLDPAFGGLVSSGGFKLQLTNNSEKPLQDVLMIIDDQYKASLSEILYYYGFWKGNQRYGRTQLRAGTTVEFTFSDDCSNHGKFRNQDNDTLPVTTHPRTIRIESAQGDGEWQWK